MKRLALAIVMVCSTLAVAAQGEGFRVNYQGAKPTVRDFAWAFVASLIPDVEDDEEAEGDWVGEEVYLYESLQYAITCQENGQPLEENGTLTIDLKNGFLVYEQKHDEFVSRIEMCYWNEADGKHKLFAVNRWSFKNGKPIMGQYDELSFFRYDNATKKMSRCDTPGFDVEYNNIFYSLPRKGKNITVTTWKDNGKKILKTLKWNGHGFKF